MPYLGKSLFLDVACFDSEVPTALNITNMRNKHEADPGQASPTQGGQVTVPRTDMVGSEALVECAVSAGGSLAENAKIVRSIGWLEEDAVCKFLLPVINPI